MVGVHADQLSRIYARLAELMKMKQSREERLRSLASALRVMWNKLYISETKYQPQMDHIRGLGLSPHAITACESEIASCVEIRRRSIVTLIGVAQARLRQAWCHANATEHERLAVRHLMIEDEPPVTAAVAAAAASTDPVAQATQLSLLENETDKMEARAASMRPLLSLISRRNDLRSSQSLTSESEPGELILITKQLRDQIPKWEAAHATLFCINGQPYLPVLLSEEGDKQSGGTTKPRGRSVSPSPSPRSAARRLAATSAAPNTATAPTTGSQTISTPIVVVSAKRAPPVPHKPTSSGAAPKGESAKQRPPAIPPRPKRVPSTSTISTTQTTPMGAPSNRTPRSGASTGSNTNNRPPTGNGSNAATTRPSTSPASASTNNAQPKRSTSPRPTTAQVRANSTIQNNINSNATTHVRRPRAVATPTGASAVPPIDLSATVLHHGAANSAANTSTGASGHPLSARRPSLGRGGNGATNPQQTSGGTTPSATSAAAKRAPAKSSSGAPIPVKRRAPTPTSGATTATPSTPTTNPNTALSGAKSTPKRSSSPRGRSPRPSSNTTPTGVVDTIDPAALVAKIHVKKPPPLNGTIPAKRSSPAKSPAKTPAKVVSTASTSRPGTGTAPAAADGGNLSARRRAILDDGSEAYNSARRIQAMALAQQLENAAAPSSSSSSSSTPKMNGVSARPGSPLSPAGLAERLNGTTPPLLLAPKESAEDRDTHEELERLAFIASRRRVAEEPSPPATTTSTGSSHGGMNGSSPGTHSLEDEKARGSSATFEVKWTDRAGSPQVNVVPTPQTSQPNNVVATIAPTPLVTSTMSANNNAFAPSTGTATTTSRSPFSSTSIHHVSTPSSGMAVSPRHSLASSFASGPLGPDLSVKPLITASTPTRPGPIDDTVYLSASHFLYAHFRFTVWYLALVNRMLVHHHLMLRLVHHQTL
jgi:hypothetical protein